ncbi:MAG: site-specific integrase [Alphaproteobacteria bacterium]|nr:site-specific integrase [Alphaproteobacteria bacterium]
MAAKVRKRTWETAKGEIRTAWIVDYKDAAGRHIETYKSKTEANEARKRIEGDIDKGVHTARSASKTIAEAAEAWLRQAETDGLERSTRRQYSQHVARILPLIGNVKLAEFRVPDVKAFRNALAAAGHRRAMQKKIVSSLGSILADALSSGAVGQNVVHAEAIANKTATRRRRMVEKRAEAPIAEGVDYPTKAELRRMLALPAGEVRPGRRPDGRIGPRNRVLLHFVVATGLRASEIRGLEWKHLDLDRGGTVTVEQRADRWNEIGAPKSSAGRRTIPLDRDMVQMLKEWRLRCPRRRSTGELVYVFPNTGGKIENLPSLHNRALVQIQKAAGIVGPKVKAPKYGMHSFRHVAISLWIEAGLSPKRVQTLAGHSTITMTFDVYGHLFDGEGDDSVVRMAAARAQLVT